MRRYVRADNRGRVFAAWVILADVVDGDTESADRRTLRSALSPTSDRPPRLRDREMRAPAASLKRLRIRVFTVGEYLIFSARALVSLARWQLRLFTTSYR